MDIKEINELSLQAYGRGILDLGPYGALWLASLILERTGNNVYKRISNHRIDHGMGTMFPDYGTNLFATI